MYDSNRVVLVDRKNNVIGTAGKLEAHLKNQLHRAFSVLIFNENGEMLIQKRAMDKYHSEGLWANACCSHQGLDEDCFVAAKRRVQEELGMNCSEFEHFATVWYQAKLDKNLFENELVTVVLCRVENDESIQPNPEEVSDFKWFSKDDLLKDISDKPEKYTYWFKFYIRLFGRDLNFR
ncbi:isopentenyl-diphosphate Delta-isomerase [Candidatus Dependentiae bacterium]